LESRRKQIEKEINSSVLDELLAKDTKNFDVTYDDIEKAEFYTVERRSRLAPNAIHFNIWRYRLALMSKKTPKPFILTSEQSDQLSTVLSTIPALNGKIKK
jgi:hypothetical protein